MRGSALNDTEPYNLHLLNNGSSVNRRRLAKRYLRVEGIEIEDSIKFSLEELLKLASRYGYIERHTGIVVPETDRESETHYILMRGDKYERERHRRLEKNSKQDRL